MNHKNLHDAAFRLILIIIIGISDIPNDIDYLLYLDILGSYIMGLRYIYIYHGLSFIPGFYYFLVKKQSARCRLVTEGASRFSILSVKCEEY